MIGKTILHYKILEKLGEGGTCPARQGEKLLMIGKHILHYRVFEELGGGGMGVFYKAEDTKVERTTFLTPLGVRYL